MRDILLDLTSHVYDLGFLDALKVTGTDQATVIDAVSEDRNVVLKAKFHTPVADFVDGLFGMPNLGRLKSILNLAEYRENATITISKDSDNNFDGLVFTNAHGDFKNVYRFMVANVVQKQMPTANFRGANYELEFEPSVASIQRLKMQASVHSDNDLFLVKTENNNLKLSFGSHSSHAGDFVFQASVTGNLKHSWSWSVKNMLPVLELSGNKIMKIGDSGVAEVIVDSGLAEYRYILPAITK
jgi:hypothetical protein